MEKFKIETKLGTLVISEVIDPDYPGVSIALERKGLNYPFGIALIECQQENDPEIVVHVYEDALDESPMDKIVIKNIDKLTN